MLIHGQRHFTTHHSHCQVQIPPPGIPSSYSCSMWFSSPPLAILPLNLIRVSAFVTFSQLHSILFVFKIFLSFFLSRVNVSCKIGCLTRENVQATSRRTGALKGLSFIWRKKVHTQRKGNVGYFRERDTLKHWEKVKSVGGLRERSQSFFSFKKSFSLLYFWTQGQMKATAVPGFSGWKRIHVNGPWCSSPDSWKCFLCPRVKSYPFQHVCSSSKLETT